MKRQVRLLYDHTNENAEKLDELMEDRPRACSYKSGRNRLRGLRNSYVKVPEKVTSNRSHRFEA